MKKTNALRLLDRHNVPYRTIEYDVSDGDLEATTVARKIDMPPERVFKTLVAKGDGASTVVFVIPGNCELDLRQAARASGHKKVELLPVKDLLATTGYVRGGCSPFAMKRPFPTYFDESIELFDEIAVSAGVVGMQVVLTPAELLNTTAATVAELV